MTHVIRQMGSFYMDINDRDVCRYKESWQIMSKKTSMAEDEQEDEHGEARG